MSTTDYLEPEDRDTVVDMINWCLVDLEGSDENGPEDIEFEQRIRKLAQKMGLTEGYLVTGIHSAEEANHGTATNS